MEQFKNAKHKESTKQVYIAIWRQFNKFIIRLDDMPNSWEAKTALYITHLIKSGAQSSTIKTYISAIKSVLADDGYEWSSSSLLLNSLVRSCRLKNDRLKTRLPILKGLLEILLAEVQRMYRPQQQFFIRQFFH